MSFSQRRSTGHKPRGVDPSLLLGSQIGGLLNKEVLWVLVDSLGGLPGRLHVQCWGSFTYPTGNSKTRRITPVDQRTLCPSDCTRTGGSKKIVKDDPLLARCRFL